LARQGFGKSFESLPILLAHQDLDAETGSLDTRPPAAGLASAKQLLLGDILAESAGGLDVQANGAAALASLADAQRRVVLVILEVVDIQSQQRAYADAGKVQ
jgi:hypothetical protein